MSDRLPTCCEETSRVFNIDDMDGYTKAVISIEAKREVTIDIRGNPFTVEELESFAKDLLEIVKTACKKT